MSQTDRCLINLVRATPAEELLNDPFGLIDRGLNLLQMSKRFGWIFAIDLNQVGVDLDRSQDVAEIVSNASGQLTYSFHFVGLLKPILQLLLFFKPRLSRYEL